MDARLVVERISVIDTFIAVTFIANIWRIFVIHIYVIRIAIMSSVAARKSVGKNLRLVTTDYYSDDSGFGPSSPAGFGPWSPAGFADRQRSFPSDCSRLGAEQVSFFLIPSCVCEYQNRACFYILLWRISNCHQLEYVFS